jgi:hypothetical protein
MSSSLSLIHASRRRQRGQALTEVALSALLVLIPIFIFGWSLYSYGQARTTALNGARYAAWERTVWRDPGKSNGGAAKSTSEIENLMVERFFVQPDAAIRSDPAGASNANLPSFYSLHNGDKSIDVERTAAAAHDGEASRPALKLDDSGKTTSSLAGVFNAIGGKLEEKGLYVAEVNLKLNAIRHVKVLEDWNLDLTQRAAVVTDAWSAGGAAHERKTVEPLVPADALGDLVGDSFSGFLEEWTPFAEFKPGCVRADVVPKDMLPQGTSQASGVCK